MTHFCHTDLHSHTKTHTPVLLFGDLKCSHSQAFMYNHRFKFLKQTLSRNQVLLICLPILNVELLWNHLICVKQNVLEILEHQTWFLISCSEPREMINSFRKRELVLSRDWFVLDSTESTLTESVWTSVLPSEQSHTF